MKVGDKLLCKKDFGLCSKNIYYIVTDITIYAVDVGEKLGTRGCYFWTYHSNNRYIWDYFYTNKDIRRKKLEEIESRR